MMRDPCQNLLRAEELIYAVSLKLTKDASLSLCHNQQGMDLSFQTNLRRSDT